MPKITTVAAMKGGAGKTMIVDNLAGCLAEESRVLLIDADPQANASSGLGIDIANQDRLTIADILGNAKTDPEAVIIKSPIEELPNLDLIPSTIWLTKTELQLVSRGGRERLLANYIEDNFNVFEQYDYILIDTNPSMGIVNQNAFYVADSIILITDVSMNGIQGIEMFQYLWDELRRDLRKEDNIRAVLINNLDSRIGLAREIIEYCETEEHLSNLFVKPAIPSRVAFKETEVEAKPINVLKPRRKEQVIIKCLVESLKEKGIF